MKNRKLGIALIIIIILFVGAIVGFSLQPAKESTETSSRVTRVIARIFVRGFRQMNPIQREEIIIGMDGTVRKCAHGTEYTVLGILLMLFFRNLKAVRWPLLVSIPAGIAVALMDEFLVQFFIPGRAPEWRDVLIDSGGVVTGALLVTAAALILLKIGRRHGGRPGEERNDM